MIAFPPTSAREKRAGCEREDMIRPLTVWEIKCDVDWSKKKMGEGGEGVGQEGAQGQGRGAKAKHIVSAVEKVDKRAETAFIFFCQFNDNRLSIVINKYSGSYHYS